MNIYDAKEVRHLFDYDPETGVLRWKNPRSTRLRPGDVAGTYVAKTGRTYVRFNGKRNLIYRVIWVWVTGRNPTGEIDHINGDTTDNRFANFRDVSRQVNAQNLRKAQRNSVHSELLGVTKHKGTGLFQAQITFNGKNKYLGRYETAEEAHQAYVKAKRKLHAGCTL